MGLPKKIGNLYFATGRRKTSVARVVLKKGKGDILINDKKIDEYFPNGIYTQLINQPFEVTNTKTGFDIKVNVYGGGLTGQACAIRHAIARAIDLFDSDTYHTPLKQKKLLTRDPRMVERKKYGQKKARKRFQFSKR